MGLIVEGEKCPICGGYVFEEDDLVFCPICGAPHHRDCYSSVGHCGLEDAHGTDNQYKKPTPAAEDEKGGDFADAEAKAGLNRDTFKSAERKLSRRCPRCGSEVEEGKTVCPSCGGPVMTVYTPFGAPQPIDPMGGVNKDEEIEGVKAEKLKNFVLINTQRYLPKFKALNRKKKRSWNWAAFLLPYQWFFYRKLYFQGVFAFIFSVISELFALSVLLSPDFASTAKTYPALANDLVLFLNENPIFYWFLGASLVITLSVRLFAGAFGDWFYRSSAINGIKEIEKSEEEAETKQLMLRKKGGVNLILGMLSITLGQYLPQLIYIFI